MQTVWISILYFKHLFILHFRGKTIIIVTLFIFIVEKVNNDMLHISNDIIIMRTASFYLLYDMSY